MLRLTHIFFVNFGFNGFNKRKKFKVPQVLKSTAECDWLIFRTVFRNTYLKFAKKYGQEECFFLQIWIQYCHAGFIQDLYTNSESSAHSGIAIRLCIIRQQNIRSTYSPVPFSLAQYSSLCHSPVVLLPENLRAHLQLSV